MIVHYSKGMGVFALVVSLILGAAAALALLFAESSLDLVAAAFLSLAGLIQFIAGIVVLMGREYFRLKTNSLAASAMLGPFSRTFLFQSLQELIVEKNKVRQVSGGKRKIFPFTPTRQIRRIGNDSLQQVKIL